MLHAVVCVEVDDVALRQLRRASFDDVSGFLERGARDGVAAVGDADLPLASLVEVHAHGFI